MCSTDGQFGKGNEILINDIVPVKKKWKHDEMKIRKRQLSNIHKGPLELQVGNDT